MPCRNFIKILFFLLFIAVAVIGYGQTPNKTSKGAIDNWQLNYNLGFTQFYGDASNNGYFKKFSGEIAFATGFTVRKYFNQSFGLGLNLWYSGVKSHKEKSATGIPVNFALTGSYFDGNLNLLIDFNNLFWGPSSRKLSVYGIIGLGYSSWNAQLVDSLTGTIINSGDVIGATTFKKGGFVVPVGLGVNYMLNDNWALNFEMNLRTVLSDDVDVWRDGFKYDQLLYTSFGVSYFFNNKSKSKPVNKPPKSTKNVVSDKPLEPSVPIYDYRLQSTNKKPTSSNFDVILIEPSVKQFNNTGVVFRVQILAKTQNLPTISSLRNRFNIEGEIFENYQDGVHRYSTGTFNSYQEALKHSYLMKNKGVYDAFVVAYQNNSRVVISSEMKNQ